MRRITLVAALTVAAFVTGPVIHRTSIALAESPHARALAAATGLGIADTATYDRGLLTYQDYLLDDAGAETRSASKQTGTPGIGVTSGDFRYPTNEGRYAGNAADIDQVRLAVHNESVTIAVSLGSLVAADSTVVGAAFDTDGDRGTGIGSWPFAAGLVSPGADVVVTFWGTGGAVTTTTGTSPLPSGDVSADLETNVVAARVARSLLPGSRWRAQLATGLWNPRARHWMAVPPGAPTATRPGGGGQAEVVRARAFNVAFRGAETGDFREERQATALAAGDIDAFAVGVDVAALDAGAVLVPPLRAGFSEGILTETFAIPRRGGGPAEGVDYDGAPARGSDRTLFPSAFHYLGRRQPFGLYVPKALASGTAGGALPMLVALHGRGATFSSHNAQPGFESDMGEAGPSPMVIVSPFGRGPLNFYADWGEKDVLEVIDAVAAWLPIDRTRVYLTGYSMGGYGTHRLGVLYPDRFAAMVSWAGTAGEYLGLRALGGHFTPAVRPFVDETFGPERADAPDEGNGIDLLENIRHVPLLQLGGALDEIQPVTGQLAGAWRLDELGYRHQFWLYPTHEHLSFALIDKWAEARTWLGDRRLVERPATVVYRTSPAWGNETLGLAHDGAYWVSGMEVAGQAAMTNYGTATATSHMLCPTTPVPVSQQQLRSGPPAYVEVGTEWREEATAPACALRNALDLDLRNLEAITIDGTAGGAGFDAGRPLVVDATSDRAVTLTLIRDGGHARTLIVPAGDSVFEVHSGH